MITPELLGAHTGDKFFQNPKKHLSFPVINNQGALLSYRMYLLAMLLGKANTSIDTVYHEPTERKVILKESDTRESILKEGNCGKMTALLKKKTNKQTNPQKSKQGVEGAFTEAKFQDIFKVEKGKPQRTAQSIKRP